MKNEPTPPETTEACERVRARLPELVDGGLAPLEEARDQGHLEACGACAEEAETWRAFHGDLGAALGGPSVAPAGLVEALAARLDSVEIAEPPRERVVLRPLQSLFAAAASLVVLFGLEALGSAMDLGDDTRGILMAPGLGGLETELVPPTIELPPLLPGMTRDEPDIDPTELLEVLR